MTKVNGSESNHLSKVLGLNSKIRFTTIIRGLPVEIEMEFRLYKSRGELRYQCFSAQDGSPLVLNLTRDELMQVTREAAIHSGEVKKEDLS